MQSGSETPIEASTTEVISVAVPGGALAVEYVTEQIPVPTRLLTAQWSTGRHSPPAYPPAAIERFRGALGPPGTLVTVQTVAGADHAASVMSPVGARATAGLISEVL